MKKALYIYLLLVSTSVFAMQPEKKNQMPVNKQPLITKQEMIGGTLIAAPVILTALTTVCYVVAPPVALGTSLMVGAAKVGATAFGTAMIWDSFEQRQKQNDKNNKQFRS